MADNNNQTKGNKGKRQPLMHMKRQPESFHKGNPKERPPEKEKDELWD